MPKVQRNASCPCGSGKKYKKCCGRVAVAVADSASITSPTGIRVRAFTDETGNSGNNLFDSGQPYFWTGTLVCEADIESEGASVHAHCLKLVGHTELHGNALGLAGIERIAPALRDVFLKHNCRFLFTRLEKAHLAATKLFDVLMDSGINKAVSNAHYGIRGLRLPLAVQLIQILDDDDRHEFWEVYGAGDAAGFRAILTRIRDRLLLFHEEGFYHDRTVQLLRDGLEWGIAHPEPLISERQGELDSPNIVAFSLLMSMFHLLHERTGAKVKSFVHDQQNQFGKFLRDSYQIFKRLNFKSTITATLLDITELPTFDCEFVMRESKNSIGLQLADVVLWLIKRFREAPGQIHGNCRDLAEVIVYTGLISGFTLRDMQEDVIGMLKRMEEKPWPAERKGWSWRGGPLRKSRSIGSAA